MTNYMFTIIIDAESAEEARRRQADIIKSLPDDVKAGKLVTEVI